MFLNFFLDLFYFSEFFHVARFVEGDCSEFGDFFCLHTPRASCARRILTVGRPPQLSHQGP
jgi:hypothetical protein